MDAHYMVPLLVALDRQDDAFLERALEEDSGALYMIDIDPKTDSLRPDLRFSILRDAAFRSIST